ncbi:DUF4345 domain-containing protein [uncultured Tateyamaria sp.]|uniref:DUF4345 domain-containing protein n=1 Tax=uncultured Tateyamaria sp. TaxID=455651 RepID=UPI002620D781|nr:DUF4345 domain-containing protein [uncultured Tateyamaria sp.]
MKLGLQIVVGILSLIPGLYGLVNTWVGAARFLEPDVVNAAIDSQFRFQSGIYFGLAIMIWYAIPRIDRATTLFRMIALTIFVGGLGRLLSWLTVGQPDAIMTGAMFLELSVPVLILWQNAIRTDRMSA